MKKMFFLIISAVLIIMGCGHNYSPPDKTAYSGTLLVLNFNSMSVSSKTIVPDVTMDVVSYDVSGTNLGKNFNETINADELLVVDDLAVGHWVINAEAKNDVGKIIASGYTGIDIFAGKITNETLTVTPLDGTGTLSLTVDWTDASQFTNTTTVTGYLTPAGESAASINFDASGDKAATHTSTLDKGYYLLSAHVQEGTETWNYIDTLRIIYNEITSATINVADIYYTGDININIDDDLENPIDITFSGALSNITPGTIMTVTAACSPLPETYLWYIDGVLLTDETNPFITIGSTLIEREAPYRLTLIVSYQDILSSESHVFTYKNNDSLAAKGHDKRIDLRWDHCPEVNSPEFVGYKIYRSDSPDGQFTHWNTSEVTRKINVAYDWVGYNDRTYYYKIIVKTTNAEYELHEGTIAWATTHNESDDEFLTGIQEPVFRYFYDGAHPVSGLTRERYPWDNSCTIGGGGFGLMAIIVGVERGFVSRENAAARVLKILNFLDNNTDRYHGAWPHWMDGETGESILFMHSLRGDLVETAFMMQGILTVHQYFNGDDDTETQIRQIADSLWREEGNCVEWRHYLVYPIEDPKTLNWHWSLTQGFDNSRHVVGFDETMITYLLAIACPNTNHNIDVSCYKYGWARGGAGPETPWPYLEDDVWYGFRQYVATAGQKDKKGMPLFYTHYSFLGFDPRGKNDGIIDTGITYYDVFQNVSLIDNAYCQNDGGYNSYSEHLWGLTASCNPFYPLYYGFHCPYDNNGTITPSAFIGAIPYTGTTSINTMRYVYDTYTEQIWGDFGFKDAFNLEHNWFVDQDDPLGCYLAINQGPIIIMIENYRTQLLWKYFTSHPDIQNLITTLKANGWTIEDISY